MSDYLDRGFNQFFSREKMEETQPLLGRELDILITEISGDKIVNYQSDGFVYTPTVESATPEEGRVYYDNETKKLRVYTGSSFETITSS